MRRKWILIFLISVLTVLFIVLYLTNKRTEISNDKTAPETDTKHQVNTQIKIENKEKVPESRKAPKISDLTFKEEINGIPISHYLAEIKNPIYSDDPALEVASLNMDFRVCGHWFHRLNGKIKNKPDLIELKNQLSEKCEAFAEQYPLLFKAGNQHDSLLNFQSNSLLGEQYQYLVAGLFGRHKVMDYDQLTEDLFELSLQIRSPSLISMGALNSGIGLSAAEGKTNFFKDLLHTQINIWVYHAHNLALQLLTCDLPNSQTCEATGFFMLYTCDNNPEACGLTVQQWYESHSSTGMKKDVEIIKSYYQEKYL